MLHPNLEIRGRPSHPDPYIREDGGKGQPPQIFSALQALVWSKNKGGPGPPGPSSGSTTAVEEPFQVIYRTLFLTTILFLDLLWVHLFIPPTPPPPPPHPRQCCDIERTHFHPLRSKFNIFGGGSPPEGRGCQFY